MFDAERLGRERGLTTRATLSENLNQFSGTSILPPDRKSTWSVPVISGEFPRVPFFWLNITGNPITKIQFNKTDSGQNSLGFITDDYQMLRDGELIALKASHTHSEGYHVLDRLQLTGSDGVFLTSTSISFITRRGFVMIEKGNSLRMGDVALPDNPDWDESVDPDIRQINQLTTGEKRFVDAQERLRIMLGVEDSDPFGSKASGNVRIDFAGKVAEMVVEPGNIGLRFSGIDRNKLRTLLKRTGEGSINQNDILMLLESDGRSDLAIGLRLREGIVRGEIGSDNAGFITNTPLGQTERRILPENIYPLVEGSTPFEPSDDAHVNEEVKAGRITTKIWKPQSLEQYQTGIGSYQVSDEPALEQAPGFKKSLRKVVGPKRKGGRNRTRFVSQLKKIF